MSHLPIAILETCLTVADVPRSRDFYSELFGFLVLNGDDHFCALGVDGKQVLLLFRSGAQAQPMALPFGTIPAHSSSGSSHIGFRVPLESLPAWLARLKERGISIESQFTWPTGGTSVYFRDLDGHLLELLTPGVWPIY